MNLGSLTAPLGARHKKKRVGCGEGSGHGGTSCRGHKGQKARAGGFHKRGFEGGQMPLVRRIPKQGFINFTRKEYAVLNVGDLKGLKAGTVIDPKWLIEERWVSDLKDGIKILGEGEIKAALVFKGVKASATAKKKIEAAGGRFEEVQL